LNPRWNALLAQTVTTIRRTNPHRWLVVGPTHWNAAHALPALQLPADKRLVLTVHHYAPFAFTHQGAGWVQPMLPSDVGCCTAAQRQQMAQPLDMAAADAKRRGLPMFIGEFGAYEAAGLADRVRYLQTLRSLMNERQLPWLVWELASGFGFYDPHAQRLREPLYQALFGAPTAP
jgi:endoglucanase